MTEEPSQTEQPPSWLAIAPMRMELVPNYSKCLGAVARERKYLMLTDAPALQDSRDFVRYVLDANFPIYVALVPGLQVVGWCDICPSRFESCAHVGTLGIGVLAEYRHQGIGRLLMERALKHARRCRIERVELTVFSNNTPAIELYQSFEFVEEGIKRRARKIDGVYEDVIMMARYF